MPRRDNYFKDIRDDYLHYLRTSRYAARQRMKEIEQARAEQQRAMARQISLERGIYQYTGEGHNHELPKPKCGDLHDRCNPHLNTRRSMPIHIIPC